MTLLERAVPDSMLLVNYERLVTEPREQLGRVYNFIDLPFRDTYTDILDDGRIAKYAPPSIDESVLDACNQLWERLLVAEKEQSESGHATRP